MMRHQIERPFFSPQKYYSSPYSITPDPENQAEIEALKRIIEGGNYPDNGGDKTAIQESLLGEGHYVVFFSLPDSDSHKSIERQLEEKGHELQIPLPINPSIRMSY